MKNFRDFLNEEVTPIATSDGSIDIEKDEVRSHLNNILSHMVNKPWVTPYNVLTKIRKALAYFHIHLPKKTYLDGEKGVEVWEIHQFGHRMGFDDQGNWIHDVPCKFYLFFQYMRTGTMFIVSAKIVDKDELDKHLDMAERMVAEEAACRQNIAKMNAPKEPMHDVTSDEKKVGNKKAVGVSQKDVKEGWAMVGKPYDKFGDRTPKAPKQVKPTKPEKDEDNVYKGSTSKKGTRFTKTVKEEQIDEKLTKGMSAGDVISDFVHSDDPKFKGKSKKERMKMALGAYYSMHPEKSRK